MIHLECLSHTPLRGYFDPAPEIRGEVDRQIAAARERVEAFDPELIVLFAPDHYNGFFYDLMPPFCIGTQACAVGDFDTAAGPLNVPQSLARGLATYVLDSGIDTALSYRMEVDHGFAQPLELLTGALDRYPVVPVFINGVAPPMAPCWRVRLLGKALGQYLATLDRRVLLIGSGGLSHEPPVPELATASPEVAERLIAGRHPSLEARQARQARTIAAAEALTKAESNLHPLNPHWDWSFLELLRDNRLGELDAYSDEWITEQAGKSAHEVRTWIAAFAALAAAGPYKANVEYYRPIPEWIAGYGLMQADTCAGTDVAAAG